MGIHTYVLVSNTHLIRTHAHNLNYYVQALVLFICAAVDKTAYFVQHKHTTPTHSHANI